MSINIKKIYITAVMPHLGHGMFSVTAHKKTTKADLLLFLTHV